MTDPYKTLGLGREASAAEIKSAYRKLAKKHHPDLNSGNAERFKNITGAYDILSNPEKKKKFDRGQLDPTTGAERPGAGFWGQWGSAQKTAKSFSFDEFDGTNNDIFSSFFNAFLQIFYISINKSCDFYVFVSNSVSKCKFIFYFCSWYIFFS